MVEPKGLVFALCLLWGVHTLAHAGGRLGDARGALLYAMYCNACHTSKIYWREQKLATDWNSLKAQVRLWQATIGLNWSEDEIADVADYLNAIYYGFPGAGQKGLLQEEKPNQVLRQY